MCSLEHDPADDAAREAGADRHQERLHGRRVRRVHGAAERRAGQQLHGAGGRMRWRRDRDRGRAGAGQRARSDPADDDRARRRAVRLLHAGHADLGRGPCSTATPTRAKTRSAKRWWAICAAARATCASSMPSRKPPGASGQLRPRLSQQPATWSKTDMKQTSPHPDRRQRAAGGCPREGDRRGALCRRYSVRARAAVRAHQAQPAPARADQNDRCSEGAPLPGVKAVVTGEELSRLDRPVPERPLHLLPRSRALRRRSGGRRGGDQRRDRREGRRPDRGGIRSRCRRCSIPNSAPARKRRCCIPIWASTKCRTSSSPQPGTNISNHFKIRKGDVEAAWAQCAAIVERDVPHPARPARADRAARGRREGG